MNFDPDFLAAARTDEELMERVENRQNYMPETIEASLAELQYRGIEFSDDDIQQISSDVAKRRAHLEALKRSIGFFNNDYKVAIVKILTRQNYTRLWLFICLPYWYRR